MRVLAVSLALAPALTSAQRPGTAQQPGIYEQAKQAYDKKQFQVAAKLFAKAAQGEQSRPRESRSDALLMQAKSLVNAGDPRPAEPVVREYLKQNSNSYQAIYLLGYILERENKPKQSLAEFTRAAAISPPRPEDLRMVALDYVLLDDYKDALRWLSRSVEGDPANTEAWYDLGRAQMHLGNFAEAERSFGRVIALDPQESRALNNLGLSYEAQNRIDEALATYRRAIEAQRRPPHPSEQPLLNLGALLNKNGRYTEAVAPLQQAIALAPSSSRCHEELSKAYAGTSQAQLAQHEMEQAVSLDPESPSLHYQLSQIYRKAGMAERAQAELKKSSDLYGSRSATIEEGVRSGTSQTPPKP
jgi:tetratricopeptide (TPR) repeat protein